MKKTGIFIFFIMVALCAISWAQTGTVKQDMMKKSEPIDIVSDRMEAFQLKKMVVFSGNVVAIQGDITLKSDQLFVYYKDKEKGKNETTKEKVAKRDLETTGDLERIEAKGNVIITQKDMTATGKEAVYYEEKAEIVLTGNPVLKDGNNTIKGCRVIVYVNESRGKVEPCREENSGRVTAVIHPKEKNKK